MMMMMMMMIPEYCKLVDHFLYIVTSIVTQSDDSVPPTPSGSSSSISNSISSSISSIISSSSTSNNLHVSRTSVVLISHEATNTIVIQPTVCSNNSISISISISITSLSSSSNGGSGSGGSSIGISGSCSTKVIDGSITVIDTGTIRFGYC